MLVGRRCGGTAFMASPSMVMAPLSGVSKPAIMRSRVVLPQPDGPSSAKNSPRATSRLTSLTTVRPPKDLRMPDKRQKTHAPTIGFRAPRLRTYSARITSPTDTVRMIAPSASTMGRRSGKRSWPQI